jgi:hypothetical protein
MNQKHADAGSSVHDPEAAMDIACQQWGPAWLRGITAFAIGGALLQTGFDLLDVQLELFSGIASFNAAWIIAMTALPVSTGVLIGMIYGYGGKYLAHFPPAAVLIISYYQQMNATLPDGVHLLPMGLMTVFVILQMEFCAVGAFFGELFMRRRTSWTSKYAKTTDAERLPDDKDS